MEISDAFELIINNKSLISVVLQEKSFYVLNSKTKDLSCINNPNKNSNLYDLVEASSNLVVLAFSTMDDVLDFYNENKWSDIYNEIIENNEDL